MDDLAKSTQVAVIETHPVVSKDGGNNAIWVNHPSTKTTTKPDRLVLVGGMVVLVAVIFAAKQLSRPQTRD